MPQNVLGKLTLNPEGDIIKSSGDLVNDERTAGVIKQILAQLAAADRQHGSAENARVSLHYSNHCLIVTRNNGNVNICKLTREPPAKRSQHGKEVTGEAVVDDSPDRSEDEDSTPKQ